MSELHSIGFVGIGTMGGPMAKNICDGGFDLAVYDANPETVAAVCDSSGAKPLSSLQELAQCDVIVCMLPTGKIVQQVLTEQDQGAFINNAKPGTIIIDMSSSEPTRTKVLGKTLKENGIVLIDAPVSGGAARAITGELTIMIGGDDRVSIDKIKPLLSSMGKNLFETGALGTGHAVKALNNMIAATSFIANVEALTMAKKFGLDQNTLMDIVNVSTGHTFMSDHVMKQEVISENYKTNFALGLITKDVEIAAGLSDAMEVNAPVCKLVRDRWAQALEKLDYFSDHSEAVKVWEK